MKIVNFLKNLIIIFIISLVALWISRKGISYLIILVAIGIITPLLCGNKKSAIMAGIFYSTFSYLLSYPSGLYLIEYMPTDYIPITVSSSTILTNLFIGWLVPTLIAIIICGCASIIGNTVYEFIYNKTYETDVNEHYFESQYEKNTLDTDNLNKKERKNLLNLTPIQKAKNKNREENRIDD